VEELLLRPLFAGDELDVVDEEQVDRTVACPELRGPVVADGVDELVGEALRGEVHDRHPLEETHGFVADRVEQVRLAEADSTVDEERVVGLGGQLGHGLAGGLGELVGRADHEGVERVPRIETVGGAAARGTGGRRRRWRIVVFAGDRIVDDDRDAGLAAYCRGGRLLERLEVMLREPVAGEAVWCADSQVVTLDREQAAGANPGIDHGRSELVRRGVEETSPKAIQHWPSPHLHTELSTGGDNSVTTGSLGYPRQAAAISGHGTSHEVTGRRMRHRSTRPEDAARASSVDCASPRVYTEAVRRSERGARS